MLYKGFVVYVILLKLTPIRLTLFLEIYIELKGIINGYFLGTNLFKCKLIFIS